MRDGPAPPDAWHNVRNLRSQASTALYELLHINSSWAGNVCAGGCGDMLQDLDGGRQLVWTYRAGLAKLLARRDVGAAARTADSYVYFAMARWMEVKHAAQYPAYPVAWSPVQSRQWNEDREAGEPGAPLPGTTDLEEMGVGDDERPDVYKPAYSGDAYPGWYAPILETMESASGNVTVDVQQPPPAIESATYSDPDPDSIKCSSSDQSPSYFDCVRTFQSDSHRDLSGNQGNKGEN
ncbi:uncharacterized protein PG986_000567 [Apiospora aurea]|uniref:Uncharacterized protein n=1 Tax=Apiospora aurea TaxID=335848 RepID=A0ABR1QUF7_9PEZI